jgi:ABC-type bacteriocin/lantibiotic exporter with double-glycine peptidase domain
MLKPVPMAHALASTLSVVYVAMWLLSMVAPALYTIVMDAKYMGTEVSMTAAPDVATMATGLVVMALFGWVVGYVWATMYNHFAKKD